MKRLNIIFIANEDTLNLESLQPVDVTDQVNLLNSMLAENPTLVEDPGIKQLLQTSALLEDEEKKTTGGSATQTQDGQEGSQTPDSKAASQTTPTEKSPLSSLPFFKDEDGSSQSFDLKKLTPENFHEFAKSLGVEPAGDTWVGDAIQKAAEQISPAQSKFEQEYNALKESIEGLPKEVHTIVNLALEGKNWKDAIGNASALDLTKDFSTLSADEKIKIHNYYFPEDIIKSGEDITKPENAKALRSAQAQYNADKVVVETKTAKAIADKQASDRAYMQSIDASIAELKKEYPDFKEKDLKAAEEIVKKGGIYNQFFTRDGNLTKDGFKKLIFALHGENILKVATSIAKNQGKNEGKSQVLAVEPGVDKSKSQGVTELTDVEKTVSKLVSDSSLTGKGLTY